MKILYSTLLCLLLISCSDPVSNRMSSSTAQAAKDTVPGWVDSKFVATVQGDSGIVAQLAAAEGYVIAREDGTAKLQIHKHGTEEWKSLPLPIPSMHAASIQSAGDHILVLGWEGALWKYYPAADRWETIDLPTDAAVFCQKPDSLRIKYSQSRVLNCGYSRMFAFGDTIWVWFKQNFYTDTTVIYDPNFQWTPDKVTPSSRWYLSVNGGNSWKQADSGLNITLYNADSFLPTDMAHLNGRFLMVANHGGAWGYQNGKWDSLSYQIDGQNLHTFFTGATVLDGVMYAGSPFMYWEWDGGSTLKTVQRDGHIAPTNRIKTICNGIWGVELDSYWRPEYGDRVIYDVYKKDSITQANYWAHLDTLLLESDTSLFVLRNGNSHGVAFDAVRVGDTLYAGGSPSYFHKDRPYGFVDMLNLQDVRHCRDYVQRSRWK